MDNQDNLEKELKNPWWLHTNETPSITFNETAKSNPCVNCPNNPKNGGSGICFCTLGMSNVYC